MDVRPIQFDSDSLRRYSSLFASCFPYSSKFDAESLHWLYAKNPDGLAVGFDAWDGEELAAHYVCVPTVIEHFGTRTRMLLSLNTATHPKYQGKGLFTKLADRTYTEAAQLGFQGVHGVANANSTPGFVRKLGFSLIEPLEARIGVGSLRVKYDSLNTASAFRRIWSASSMDWRCSNPANKIMLRQGAEISQFFATAKGSLLSAYGELESTALGQISGSKSAPLSPFRLFLGLYPKDVCNFSNYVNIPTKFRPSPLNFIFRSLTTNAQQLGAGQTTFSFLDFDAY